MAINKIDKLGLNIVSIVNKIYNLFEIVNFTYILDSYIVNNFFRFVKLTTNNINHSII